MQVMIYVTDQAMLDSIRQEALKRGLSVSGYLVGLHAGKPVPMKKVKRRVRSQKQSKPDSQTAGYIAAVKNHTDPDDSESMSMVDPNESLFDSEVIPEELSHDEKLRRLRDMTPSMGAANELNAQPKEKDK